MAQNKNVKRVSEEEIAKSIKYVDYFIESFCKVESTGKGLTSFVLYKYQKRALQNYMFNDKLFVLKSRQMGFTTLAAAFSLWKVLVPGENVLFLSKREEDAMDILRKVKIMYDYLPEEFKYILPLKTSNASTMEFSNDNRIHSLPATERAGAGRTASLIILDEFSAFPGSKANIPGEEVWRSIYPTISTGGKVIVQSTPKGIGNKFYHLYAQDNSMKKMKILWWEHPVFGKGLKRLDEPDEYGHLTSPWADDMKSNMTADDWAQEFNGDFLQSGRPVFSLKSLVKHEITDDDKFLGDDYVVGVDLASGTGKDFHVAQFLNARTGKQVECYRSKEPLDVFAKNLKKKCYEEYPEPLLAFENNSGYGLTFMKEFQDYTNLYHQERLDRRTMKKTRKVGWNTNTKTKSQMIADLSIALVNGHIKVSDSITIDELTAYQYDENDKMNAPPGLNDDTVTSLAIAWQARLSIQQVEDEDEDVILHPGMRKIMKKDVTLLDEFPYPEKLIEEELGDSNFFNVNI